MASERLFILDGMALAYRAYFTFITRPLVNSKGENTSAVYGFVSALMRILEAERPEYVAVAFDTREPTFRHRRYAQYKATRQKMPESMASQMDKLKEVVRAFNTPLLELPGYEADDIIGTLARRAEREQILTYMVTGDKDFMQLVGPLTRMYKPGKFGGDPEIVGMEEVLKKFGVPPAKVIDVLGLAGDSSDNVPGVPGIGKKTAIPLIQQFGTIPEMYEHLDEIPQKGIRQKLIAHRESALLSRELVTIHTDVPIATDIHELKAAEMNRDEVLRLFRELEFRTLVERILKSEAPAPRARVQESAGRAMQQDALTIASDSHAYSIIRSGPEFKELLTHLKSSRIVVLTTEAASIDPLTGRLIGMSFCTEARKAYVVPIDFGETESVTGEELFEQPLNSRGKVSAANTQLSLKEVLNGLRPILEDPQIAKIGHNIKKDVLVLRNHGIEVQNISFDTMVAGYVMRPDAGQSLEAFALEYLSYKTISQEELVGTGKLKKHILQVPSSDLENYAAERADIIMRIYEVQRGRLRELGLEGLCLDVEFPLIPVLASMEFAGVRLNKQHLAEMSRDLERQIILLVGEIHLMAGEQFNINSTQQLADILFKRLNLRTIRKTKTGFSTDATVLENLRGEHPIIDKLLDYRLLTKLKSTYVDALPLLVNPRTGRVHTSFNQTVAATGRLASSDPNLQNIPIRSAAGRLIRRAFVPGSDGMVLLSADYSQIELRVMAHICRDPGLSEAFTNGEDIHSSTAAKVFGVEIADVTLDMRRKAKEVNFGIMYGLGPFGLANRLEITQVEAKEIIANYFRRFPGVKEYMESTIASARKNGFVTTLLGRRRYLPDIGSKNQNVRSNAERQAINMPIQGTAADMIKKAMILIDGEIRKRWLLSRMLLQVHDELLFEVPEDEVDQIKELVVRQMKRALPLSVPVGVEVGTGNNWLEAH